MEAKSIRLTFQAPIVFELSHEIDIEEIEEEYGNVENYISIIMSDNLDGEADAMYHYFKDELLYKITKSISLKKVEKLYRKAGEYDF